MAGKPKRNIGREIVDGLKDLHAAVNSDRPLKERFTVRCVELDLEPTEYDPEAVRLLRMSLNASQAVFAKLLGASVKTVEGWESGNRAPSRMACRLMDELARNRSHWLEKLRNSVRTHANT